MIQHHVRPPREPLPCTYMFTNNVFDHWTCHTGKILPSTNHFVAEIGKIQKYLFLRMYKKMVVFAMLLNPFHVPLCQTLLI